LLCPHIWSRVSGLIRFCDVSDSGTESNFVHISEKVRQGTLTMIRQGSGEESMSRLNGMTKLAETDKGETCEAQSQEHAHHFL
jgi:hypothetical protein